MNRIFRFEMAVKTGLIITLALAVVLAAGCPKKQDKSVKSPTAPTSSEKKPPVQNTGIKAPAAEVNQNAVAAPVKTVTGKKPTVAAQTPAKEVKPSAAGTQQALKPTTPEPADMKPYESLKETEEKVDFITEYADQHPESEALMVYKVLDDNDVEVRTAAMEMLAMKELDDSNVIYVAAKALKDSELQIRESAIEACAAVTDPAVGNVLIEALNDSSEEVRTAAIQAADQKEMPIRLSVLKAGITSQNEDVKEDAVSSLIDASTPEAVDILIGGLKDTNPDFRDSVKSAIDFLVSPDKEFETYDQAVKWWNANRNKFDNELNAKD